MLENLLKKCYNEELSINYDSESVKTAVLSRIEKENHMKRFRVKPLIIAAVVSVTAAAVSIVTVNASRDGFIKPKEPKIQDYIDGDGNMLVYYETENGGGVSSVDTDIDDFSSEGMTLINQSETDKNGLWIVTKTFAENIPNVSDPTVKRQLVVAQKAVYNNEGEHYFTMFISAVFETNGADVKVLDSGHYFAETEKAGQVENLHSGGYKMENQFKPEATDSSSYVEYSNKVKLNDNDRRLEFVLWIKSDANGNIQTSE